MKDELGAKGAALRKRDAGAVDRAEGGETPFTNGNGHDSFHANGQAKPGRLDVWVALDLLLRRWHWLVLGSVASAAVFFLLACHYIGPKFTASAQLLRYQLPGVDFPKADAGISTETFAGLIRAPDLLRQVGARLKPPLEPEQLNKAIKIDPDPDSDILVISVAARRPEQAVQTLNLYLQGAVDYTKELQSKDARRLANDYLRKQVDQMGGDLTALERQFRTLPAEPLISSMTNKFAQVGTNLTALSASLNGQSPSGFMVAEQMRQLQVAMGELAALRAKYTDLHPLVIGKNREVDILRKELRDAMTNSPSLEPLAGSGLGDSRLNPDVEIILTKLRALEDSHLELKRRQREAQLYAEDPPGVARILAPATMKAVKANSRMLKLLIVTILGGLMGLGASLGLVTITEFADGRLKTQDDVSRVTKLPIFATLGNLNQMEASVRSQWAFRTWTMLQGRLSPSVNHGLVCGVTSSSSGEGRSTWISLLAEAASLTGYRVLTIATRPSPTHGDSALDDPDGFLPEDPEAGELGDSSSTALTTNVLSAPAQVTDQLTGPNSQPVVHIPLPGWVWNLERRKQWREALEHWRQIENLVILVELPPASVPEAVLLGSNLPNMVWLADSRKAKAAETRTQLQTLRDARCHLVGALLNYAPALPVKMRFPRWIECTLVLVALGLWSAHGQTNGAPALAAESTNSFKAADAAPGLETDTNAAPAQGSFSIVQPSQRGQWQQHLTLGPGDIISLGLYGEPDLTRADLAIAPDGRVNYLEAQNVLATGLTIDELRDKLDQELSKYRRAPRTLITPVAFRSKKYYMLGKVAVKGVYTLDRPITVLEAIARARGIENGLVDRNIVDLADYSRSFLARGGKRYPLNFEKLFQTGDLSQNIAVEPGDYIYLASANVGEVYVVGEVRLPGVVTYTPTLTIMQALTARGGYTDRAYKAKVLVIRGSLNHPEKFAVNTHAILDAKATDFKLKAGDIIYVNSRPFILVEELADLAVTAFIQSVITEWVGVDIVQPINNVP